MKPNSFSQPIWRSSAVWWRSPGVKQKGFGGTQRGKETGKGVHLGTSKQAVRRRSKKIWTQQQQQKSFQPILMQESISDYNTGYLWLIKNVLEISRYYSLFTWIWKTASAYPWPGTILNFNHSLRIWWLAERRVFIIRFDKTSPLGEIVHKHLKRVMQP